MPRVNVVTSGSFYGRESFNPSQILQQVAFIQAAFYLSDFTIILLLDYILNIDLHTPQGASPVLLRQIFDHRLPALDTSAGLVSLFAFYASILFSSTPAFTYLVGRSKRALDFSSTLLLVHFTLCALLYGIPTSSLWWFMVASAGIAMVLSSEALSRRLELRQIAVPPRDAENPDTDADSDSA